MESDVQVTSVEEVQTKSGKTRYVLRDAEGREYTTFRPQIGRDAAGYEGRRAHITFHEEQRGDFLNVYLDAVGPAADGGSARGGGDGAAAGSEPDEVGWSTAIEAAPWLLGTSEPEKEIAPEDFFEKLEPFKRLVAEDIRGGEEALEEEEDGRG